MDIRYGIIAPNLVDAMLAELDAVRAELAESERSRHALCDRLEERGEALAAIVGAHAQTAATVIKAEQQRDALATAVLNDVPAVDHGCICAATWRMAKAIQAAERKEKL